MSNGTNTAVALPDLTAIVAAELEGLGDYGRITLTLDVCAGKLARYTINRERSVKAGHHDR
jgi:hypothetical protein